MKINNINLSSLSNYREILKEKIRRFGSQGADEPGKAQDQNNVNDRLSTGKRINAGDPGSIPRAGTIPSIDQIQYVTVPFENTEDVADAAGVLDQFKQSEAFVQKEMPKLKWLFRQAVTTIGVDQPEKLGTFLAEFSGDGLVTEDGFKDYAAGFMKAAQNIAQHAPDSIDSFIDGATQLFNDSPENLGNYFTRIAEVATQFGSDGANKFAGLFTSSSIEPELMDEFFVASDAIRAGAPDSYSKFLDRMGTDLKTAGLDGNQAAIYLEYAAGLAETGDVEGLNSLLGISISDFTPSASSTGTVPDLAVTGVDMQVQLETEEFGSSDSDQPNTAVVNIRAEGNDSETAVGGLSQTIFFQEGMHATGNQPVDISFNIDYMLAIRTGFTKGHNSIFPGNFPENIEDNEITFKVRLVEIDGENREILAEKTISTLQESSLAVKDPPPKTGKDKDFTFEDIMLDPGKNYAIEFVFENTANSGRLRYSEVYGEMTLNELSIDFENTPDYTNNVAVEQRDVPRHPLYLTNEDHEKYQAMLERINTNNDPQKIIDADLAAEQSNMTQLMLQQQLGTQALAQANLNPGAVLNLFA